MCVQSVKSLINDRVERGSLCSFCFVTFRLVKFVYVCPKRERFDDVMCSYAAHLYGLHTFYYYFWWWQSIYQMSKTKINLMSYIKTKRAHTLSIDSSNILALSRSLYALSTETHIYISRIQREASAFYFTPFTTKLLIWIVQSTQKRIPPFSNRRRRRRRFRMSIKSNRADN